MWIIERLQLDSCSDFSIVFLFFFSHFFEWLHSLCLNLKPSYNNFKVSTFHKIFPSCWKTSWEFTLAKKIEHFFYLRDKHLGVCWYISVLINWRYACPEEIFFIHLLVGSAVIFKVYWFKLCHFCWIVGPREGGRRRYSTHKKKSVESLFRFSGSGFYCLQFIIYYLPIGSW